MFLQAVYSSPLWVQACFLALLFNFLRWEFFFPLPLTRVSYHTQNRANLECLSVRLRCCSGTSAEMASSGGDLKFGGEK